MREVTIEMAPGAPATCCCAPCPLGGAGGGPGRVEREDQGVGGGWVGGRGERPTQLRNTRRAPPGGGASLNLINNSFPFNLIQFQMISLN